MTADDYRQVLGRLGLTQIAAARLLGVNTRTSQRWAGGTQDITPPAARFLRYLDAQNAPIDETLLAWLDASEPRG